MSSTLIVVVAYLLLALPAERRFVGFAFSPATSNCSQPTAERNNLMREAESNEFTVRRVEFMGLTYTRDQVIRDRMTPIVQEGDPFSRGKLVKSLQNMNKLKRAIYPLRLRDAIIRLDKSGQFVDMTICFRQRPRQRVIPQ